jgi:hypothetical protein
MEIEVEIEKWRMEMEMDTGLTRNFELKLSTTTYCVRPGLARGEKQH